MKRKSIPALRLAFPLQQTGAGKVFIYFQNLFRVTRPRLGRATDERRLLLPLVDRDMYLGRARLTCTTIHLYDYLAPVAIIVFEDNDLHYIYFVYF